MTAKALPWYHGLQRSGHKSPGPGLLWDECFEVVQGHFPLGRALHPADGAVMVCFSLDWVPLVCQVGPAWHSPVLAPAVPGGHSFQEGCWGALRGVL